MRHRVDSRLTGLAQIVIALALGACSSAPHAIDQEELSANWSGQAYTDLLIVGAYTDRTYRAAAEAQFVEELASRGVKATASLPLIPDTTALESNAEVRAKLAATAHDAVLVIATLDEGYDYDVDDYYRTRGMVYLLGGEPGAGTAMGSFITWAGSGFYSLYVGLWDVESYQPVWQITTNSATTGSEAQDNKALADFVVDALRQKGLL